MPSAYPAEGFANTQISSMTYSSSTTQEYVMQHVTRLALHVNEPLVHYLVVGRAVCRDLDTLLILLVIIQRANRHPEFAGLEHADLIGGGASEIPSLAVNLLSIAGSTGIPRETVRRKVGRLVEIGWVARKDTEVRLTVEGYRAITPLRDAAVRMTGRITDAVNTLASMDATLSADRGAERDRD
jgi:hypothetical protein